LIEIHNEERRPYKAMIVEETSKEHQKKDEFPFRIETNYTNITYYLNSTTNK